MNQNLVGVGCQHSGRSIPATEPTNNGKVTSLLDCTNSNWDLVNATVSRVHSERYFARQDS